MVFNPQPFPSEYGLHPHASGESGYFLIRSPEWKTTSPITCGWGKFWIRKEKVAGEFKNARIHVDGSQSSLQKKSLFFQKKNTVSARADILSLDSGHNSFSKLTMLLYGAGSRVWAGNASMARHTHARASGVATRLTSASLVTSCNCKQ